MSTWRSIGRLVALALLGGCLVIGANTPAHACSCALRPTAERVTRADAVFAGTVGATVPGLLYTRTVDVASVYKGDVPAVVTVNTGQEGPHGEANTCNYSLDVGEELLFFADGEGDPYSLVCNHPLQAGKGLLHEVEMVTGESPVTYASAPAGDPQEEVPDAEPDSGQSGPGRWVWPGLGLVALAVAVVVVLRRRSVGGEV